MRRGGTVEGVGVGKKEGKGRGIEQRLRKTNTKTTDLQQKPRSQKARGRKTFRKIYFAFLAPKK